MLSGPSPETPLRSCPSLPELLCCDLRALPADSVDCLTCPCLLGWRALLRRREAFRQPSCKEPGQGGDDYDHPQGPSALRRFFHFCKRIGDRLKIGKRE